MVQAKKNLLSRIFMFFWLTLFPISWEKKRFPRIQILEKVARDTFFPYLFILACCCISGPKKVAKLDTKKWTIFSSQYKSWQKQIEGVSLEWCCSIIPPVHLQKSTHRFVCFVVINSSRVCHCIYSHEQWNNTCPFLWLVVVGAARRTKARMDNTRWYQPNQATSI